MRSEPSFVLETVIEWGRFMSTHTEGVSSPAAPAPVRASSLERNGQRRSFLTDVVIEHGPKDVLGRLFLRADTALREAGVFVSFVDYDELKAVNRENSDSWRPLLPLFDPDVSGIREEDGFAIVGRNASGKAVFAQASRHYDLSGTTLKDEIESLRIFYRDPEISAVPGEAMPCSAPVAARLSGSVVFTGAAWLHRDYRGKGIQDLTRPVGRALSFTSWSPEVIFSFMAPELIRAGMAEKSRMHVDFEVTMTRTPVKREGIINAGIVWITAEEQIRHFADYYDSGSGRRDAQVDTGVLIGPAEKQVAG
jgi:hypothetical protein